MFEAPRQIGSGADRPDGLARGFAPLAPIDFAKLWATLWRGRLTILAAMLAALALAVLFILFAPQRFTATTQILIEPGDLRAVGNEPNPASQLSEAQLMQVESQVQELTSDSVLRRVVVAQGLDHDPEFVRPPSPLASLFGAAKRADPTLTALAALKRDVRVFRAERTFVVSVSVVSKEAAKAAAIANAIAQAYLEEQTEVRAAAARQVSQTVSARLKELKDRLQDSEERVEAYKARHNIVDANGQLVGEQALADLNNQLTAARTRTAEAKARLEQVELVQRSKGEIGAFPEAVQSPIITALRSQYAEVLRREAEQTATLGARHPAVIDIEAQAERLRHMIDDEVNRIAVAARTEYASAKAAEDMLAANLDALKSKKVDTNEALVGLRELEREVAANRSVYEAFLVRARESGEQSQLDTKNIRIISKADVPLRPTFPPSAPLLVLGALALGAAAGAGLAFLRGTGEAAARRRNGGGTGPRGGSKLRLPWSAAAAPPEIPVLAVVPAVDVSYALAAVADPASSFGREIRHVCDAVKSEGQGGDRPRVLLACSGHEDDSAAVVLAIATAAAADERVLLIDADLEQRALAAIDADRREAGLVDVATGRRSLAEVTARDRQTNVTVVPLVAPHSRRERGRRISDADIAHAFAQTRRFDRVIVSAMDYASDPSARFLAPLVDHIVLVAGSGAADESAAEKFVDALGADADKLRGAVLIESGED